MVSQLPVVCLLKRHQGTTCENKIIVVSIYRWPSALAGVVLGGVSLSMIPFVNTMLLLMLPMGCLGFGLGMVESSVLPQLAHLVDLRHKAAYGTVYAIGDVSMNLGSALGSLLLIILLFIDF